MLKATLKYLVKKIVPTGGVSTYFVRLADNYLATPFERSNHDLTRFAQAIATTESARYLIDHMVAAKNCYTQRGLLDFAAGQAKLDGLTLEFGVYQGDTIRHIAARRPGKVYGFDSFRGLPQEWRFDVAADLFDLNGALPRDLPANVELVVGLFDDTLPRFLETHPGPASLVHVDCDVYASAKTVLTRLAPRIAAGTVIVFDEYFNYVGWQQHEHKAFMEFIAETGLRYEYIGFASSHLSVAVRIK